MAMMLVNWWFKGREQSDVWTQFPQYFWNNDANCLGHCLASCLCLSFQICGNTSECQLCTANKYSNPHAMRQFEGCTSYNFGNQVVKVKLIRLKLPHVVTHSNLVNSNQAALRSLVKQENISWSSQAKQTPASLCVRFKYASFYRRFRSFQSLFGSLFSLVWIAVWIYFNRLQNTWALELNYSVFEKHIYHQAHKQHKYPYALFFCTLQARSCFYRRFQ